jgi:hypothetical protein
VHAYLHRKEGDHATQPISTAEQASPCAGNRSMRNGSALSKVCLADQTDNAAAMKLSFEQTLIEVWGQALVENANVVLLGTERYPVRGTPKPDCGMTSV